MLHEVYGSTHTHKAVKHATWWNDNEKVYSSGRKHIFNVQGTRCTLDNRAYLRAGFIGAVVEGHTLCPLSILAHCSQWRSLMRALKAKHSLCTLEYNGSERHRMVTVYYLGSIWTKEFDFRVYLKRAKRSLRPSWIKWFSCQSEISQKCFVIFFKNVILKLCWSSFEMSINFVLLELQS